MKKVFLLLVLLFSIATLSGCNQAGSLQGVISIKKEDIFNQKEDKYYIYFHRLDCEDCEASAPYVIQYAHMLKDYKGCAGKRKIYAVLLYTEEEKPGEEVYIYRKYTGEDGQGTDGNYYVNGVTDWRDLYIATTSSLIAINTEGGVKTARYSAQGWESVRDKLNAQLGSCHLK
ncbi:MAG: hypothetical protein PHC64_11030 [Candidatus Gastranaerophilales bacterium]|nr:hypothetical protein [Candidatus Gastranaerophilales bacterium]